VRHRRRHTEEVPYEYDAGLQGNISKKIFSYLPQKATFVVQHLQQRDCSSARFE
jgi:hypothetical protein